METRLTEISSLEMYFNNNDYIDDGGAEDPDKVVDPGFGAEEETEGGDDGTVDPGSDDDKGSMME